MTVAGFGLGARLASPVLPGMVAFGLAVGTTAAIKGLSFFDTVMMSVLVHAGMSQLVALEAWPDQFTLTAIATLTLITATVNARLLLMSAALYPWLSALPPRQIYPALHLVTDPSWLIAMRYRAEGGSDIGAFLGWGGVLAIAFVVGSAAGYLAGALITDPRRYGIDLVMPIFFTALLIPLWRGKRRATAWVAAGAVALLVQHTIGGWWFVVAGAVAGSIAGGFFDDD